LAFPPPVPSAVSPHALSAFLKLVLFILVGLSFTPPVATIFVFVEYKK
jgi:hypothetical protein